MILSLGRLSDNWMKNKALLVHTSNPGCIVDEEDVTSSRRLESGLGIRALAIVPSGPLSLNFWLMMVTSPSDETIVIKRAALLIPQDIILDGWSFCIVKD